MENVEILGPTKACVDGRECAYFAGSNYLGLAHDAYVTNAAIRGIEKYGVSIGASRVISGSSDAHVELERQIATFCGTEAAVCLPTGYLANNVVIEALDSEFSAWFVDEAAHVSIQRPLLSLSSKVFRFRHCCPDDLASQVKKVPGNGSYAVILDSVFPLLGTLAPLKEMLSSVRADRCVFVLDEAHSIGVLGSRGRGVREYMNLEGADIIHTGSLAKAFGVHGGFVAASKPRIERIRCESAAYAGATPLPPALCVAATEAIESVSTRPELLSRLHSNASRMREKQSLLELPTPAAEVPIFSYDLENAADAHRLCLAAGLYLPLFAGYPGCPAGGILRWTIHSGHTSAEIDRIGQCLEEIIEMQSAAKKRVLA